MVNFGTTIMIMLPYILGHSSVMQCNGGCQISRKKHYEDILVNLISITRGWVGVCQIFSGKTLHST